MHSMALRERGLRQPGLCLFIGMLFIASAAVEESVSTPSISRKQIEAREEGKLLIHEVTEQEVQTWDLGSTPSISRKQIEAQEYGKLLIHEVAEQEEQNWDLGDGGELSWKSLIWRVLRIANAEEEQEWPELKLGARTVSAGILSALVAGVASAAGLGGGVLFFSIVNLLLLFDPRTSAAVANFMILGGTSVGVAVNLIRDNPTEFNKPLVDFDIAIILQPNMLLGISIGVILNRMLPNWLITGILTLLLIFVAVYTARNALKRWAAESRRAAEKGKGKKRSLTRSNTASEKELTENVQDFYKSSSSRYPVNTILGLLFVWLAMFAVQILRGGHHNPGLIKVKECGVGYWLLTAMQIPVAFGVTAWVIYRLHEPSVTNEAGTSEAQDPGCVLGRRQGILFSGVALLAGIVGGMLGVGGAMVINPALLSAGVPPQVTAATTLLMVFFSSSMSVAQYWIMGRIPVAFALMAALLCAISSAVGILGVQRIVTKFKRPSVIVFVVAIVIAVSAVLMCIIGSWKVWNDHKSGAYMGFSYPC